MLTGTIRVLAASYSEFPGRSAALAGVGQNPLLQGKFFCARIGTLLLATNDLGCLPVTSSSAREFGFGPSVERQ